mgnify:CR=1 FL=1
MSTTPVTIEGKFDGPVIDEPNDDLYPVCEEKDLDEVIKSPIIIVLDNGHGKETPGKRSPIWPDGSQLFEWKFNRDITKRVYNLLDTDGYIAIIIVPEDIDVTLEERCKRANKIHSQQSSIFISIHANGGGGTGFEAYTTPGPTKSDTLAEFIYKSFGKNIPKWKLRKDTTDGDSDKESNFYVIKNTKAPAVLLECGFMDTYSDCKFMISEEGKVLISKAIFEGITNYLNSIKS